MTTNYKTSFLLPHDYEIPTFNYPQYVLPPKESSKSNWKLMPKASSNRLSHPNYLNIADNRNYIFIYNNDIPKNYKIIKIINDGFKIGSNIYKFVGEHIIRPSGYWNAIVKSSYQWNGQNEPETPTINKDTGEITDWK